MDDSNGITQAQAARIAEAACAEAGRLGLAVSVAVVDAGGNLVHATRMDGANFLSPDIARGKATTAAAWRQPSAEVAERWKAPHVAPGMVGVTHGRIVPVQGALPVQAGGRTLGAVGVSGARSDQDEAVARAGLAALGG